MTYPDPQSSTVVELAFGADLTADQDTWSWTDVTPALAWAPITISRGRHDEQGGVEAGDCTVVLDNVDGAFTPDHPLSPYYPHVVTGTPIRVTVHGSVRFVGHVASWEPEWPEADVSRLAAYSDVADPTNPNRGHGIVTVRAAGVLQRMQSAAPPLRSPIWRATMAQPLLLSYWPLEEAADASIGASPVPRTQPAGIFGFADVEPGAEPVAPGSGPSIRLTAGVTTAGAIRCVPLWTAATGWAVESCFRIEEDTAGGNVWQMAIRERDDGALWTVTASLAGQTMTLTTVWQPDPDDSGSAVTLDTSAVDRGVFHQARLVASMAGAARLWRVVLDGEVLASDVAVGSDDPTAINPVQSIDISAATINVGHVAIYRSPDSDPPLTWRAVEGWAGERALDRFERLSLEEGVRFRHVAPTVVDTFSRTVSNGWGTADTGQSWTTHGTASGFAVTGGLGFIDAPAGVIRAASLDGDHTDVDVTVFVESLEEAGGVDLRMDLSGGYGSRSGYACYVDFFGDLIIFRMDGGAETPIGFGGWDGGFLVGGFWLRVQAVGSTLRMKVWGENESEPSLWSAEADDGTYSSGQVTLWTSEGETQFDNLSVTDMPRTPRMGVQQIATLAENLQNAADADGGILLETRHELGLTFRPLSTLYHQTAGMTLDAAADGVGDISNPLQPVLDDQTAVNDVTVVRLDGSSARAVDTTDIARRGLRDQEITLNLNDDGQLPDQASWRLHLGTWPTMRYPVVVPQLDGRPSLYLDWLPMEVGDRIDLANLPPQHPPNDVPLMLQGYTETITPTGWEVEATCSPYGPLIVGERLDGSDTPGPADPVRRDSSGSELASPFVAGSDTTMSVATSGGVLWAVTGASNVAFPFDVDVGGVRVRVTGITGSSSPQTFTVQQAPVNGVVKTVPAGTAVRLWQPAHRAL